MLDRKGWQTERIGAGDLHVIRMVLAPEEPMDRGMREALLAGLPVAAQGSERTLPAHALRRLGEWPEQGGRSEEHTPELRSLMRISYAVSCLKNTRFYTKTACA